jgi:RNA-directed DNA polymerase
VKFDLTNFYTTVGFSRVVAIFRRLGYSREAAIWLGLLTTTAVPSNLPFDRAKLYAVLPYLRRHLPQGAPTSPALANLSAFHLDARLSGLAKSFGAQFTRYADDLTISGPVELSAGLRTLIPLVEQIIRRERFQSNRQKRQVLRANQRQSIAGVVVNTKTNVKRADFDHLKAILTNCVRLGPSTQNRQGVADFAAHLRGRIAHVIQLNAARGKRLLEIYNGIDWRR